MGSNSRYLRTMMETFDQRPFPGSIPCPIPLTYLACPPTSRIWTCLATPVLPPPVPSPSPAPPLPVGSVEGLAPSLLPIGS